MNQTQYIQSVQLTEYGGYLLNGNMSVPNAPGNRHYEDIQRWIAEGNTPDPVPGPTPEQIKYKLESALDRHIDSVAQAKGYDNRLTCLSYAAFDNPWQQEAIVFGVWRSNCYTTAHQIMSDVQAGTRDIPTEEQLISEMPAMVWPD
jgi:hypothetical protein